MSDIAEVHGNRRKSEGTSGDIDGERKKSVETQTSWREDQGDKREGSSGNVWTNDSTSWSSSSSQASALESFAETCEEVLSLDRKGSDNKTDKLLSSAFSKLDTNDKK